MTAKEDLRVKNSYSANNSAKLNKWVRTGLKGKESRKNAQLRFYYGIGLEDYNRMYQEQNGCCKICQRHQTELKNKLNVDHCHNKNSVRALLCNQCNQALGLLKENPTTIKNMLEYVQ